MAGKFLDSDGLEYFAGKLRKYFTKHLDKIYGKQEEIFFKLGPIHRAYKAGTLKGDPGPQGERGPKGDPGPQGERGPKGDPGLNGTSWSRKDIKDIAADPEKGVCIPRKGCRGYCAGYELLRFVPEITYEDDKKVITITPESEDDQRMHVTGKVEVRVDTTVDYHMLTEIGHDPDTGYSAIKILTLATVMGLPAVVTFKQDKSVIWPKGLKWGGGKNQVLTLVFHFYNAQVYVTTAYNSEAR